jgi:hypothetical protein
MKISALSPCVKETIAAQLQIYRSLYTKNFTLPLSNVAHVPLYSPLIPLSLKIFFAQSRGPLYFAFPADAC